jgi:WD40 repeat protein
MVALGVPGATPFGGHAGPVNCVAFSPDDTTFATGGDDGVVRLWDSATREQIGQFTAQSSWPVNQVKSVAYSPDGNTLAATGWGYAMMWDTLSGKERGRLAQRTGQVLSLAYSPDGTHIATTGTDGKVLIWDVAIGELVTELTGHTGSVSTVAYGLDGSVLATGGEDGTVRTWDTASQEQIFVLLAPSGTVRCVRYSPDGSGIASCGMGAVLVWESGTGAPSVELRLQQSSEPAREAWSVESSPDGASIAASDDKGFVRQSPEFAREAWSVDFSPDGASIAASDDKGFVWIWDSAGRVRTELTGHVGPVYCVAFSRDGATLATCGWDGTVRLWDVATDGETATLTGHSGMVDLLAYSPDGAAIATGGRDGAVRIWDAITGAQTAQINHQLPRSVNAIAYSPDGLSLGVDSSALADDDSGVSVWDTVTWQRRTTLPDTGPERQAIAYNPAGTIIAVAGHGGSVEFFDAGTGQPTGRIAGDGEAIRLAAYSPDGTLVATSGTRTIVTAGSPPTGGVRVQRIEQHSVRLWDVATGQAYGAPMPHPGQVDVVTFSPDGAILATGDHNGTVRLRDVTTQSLRRELAGHDGAITAISYSPDGTWLATAAVYGSLRLWEASTGEQVRELDGHTGTVRAATFSPDGRIFASAGDDGTIRIWNPRDGKQVNGTGFEAALGIARPLAAVNSDSPSAKDSLGVRDDVMMLAELIGATQTAPPLAIALIGAWGAGKSSVMLQVEEAVDKLAEEAADQHGLSAFAENVRQVRFNAWHYSDDQLWTGLVSHLFEKLASPLSPVSDGSTPDQQVIAKRKKLRHDLEKTQRASRQLAAELKAVDAVPRRSGLLAWFASPIYDIRVLLTALRQGYRDLPAIAPVIAIWAALVIVIWAGLGSGAYLAWRFVGGWRAYAVTAVTVVGAPSLTAVIRRLRFAHDWFHRFARQQSANLTDRQHEYQETISSLKDQLVLIDAAEGLTRFLEEGGGGGGYQKYQGLLGQVRADLDQLSIRLKRARAQWQREGRNGRPPLERIVLYIDDLDRCPPRRVAELLEAIHLMLALDLFVVVVAVDARWLIKSLEYHYHELFGRGDVRLGRDGASKRDAGGGEEPATAIDYLDKIFQIPFTLLPPAPEAMADYLRSLLPGPVRHAQVASVLANEDASVAQTHGERILDEAGESILDEAGEPLLDQSMPENLEADAGESAGAHPATVVMEPDARRLRDPRGLTVDQPGEVVTVELGRQGLRLSQAEVDFMERLGGLIPTPRAAKRLVNIYRLVRIGIPDEDELARFVGDEEGGAYQAVQVLLALLVGYPEFTREIFLALLDKTNGGDLVTLAEKVGGSGEETRTFAIIKKELATIREAAVLAVDVGKCRQWCPQLARFSFYTRDLAGVSPRLPVGATLPSRPVGSLAHPVGDGLECGHEPGDGVAAGHGEQAV